MLCNPLQFRKFWSYSQFQDRIPAIHVFLSRSLPLEQFSWVFAPGQAE
jgi:hypothetical protein